MLSTEDVTRFWNKVSKTDTCWNWTAAKMSKGYGTFDVNGKTQRAHRISFLIANGYLPKKLQILHKCDNRLCVNPDHLFEGTPKDNTKDMISKGRQSFYFQVRQGSV